jgi:adhesin transport system outer membrane protein
MTKGLAKQALTTTALLALLTGCMGGGGSVTKSALSGTTVDAGLTGTAFDNTKSGSSDVIRALQGKPSALALGSAFGRVADAVLATYSGAEQTQLRMAQLRADARAQNWLPRIGPNLSLSGLSGLAAGISIEHGILDNGKRKAEREFALADVDVTAVGMVAEVNQRVYDGVSAYIQAERARSQAAVSRRAVDRLAEFQRIMGLRVEGGISDNSELRVITQRVSEMQATLSTDAQNEANALSTLATITSGTDLSGISGLDALSITGLETSEPLAVLRARAEGNRAMAEARAGRAVLLPGLNGAIGINAKGVDPGIKLGGAFGAGTRQELDALAAAPELAERRTAAMAETAQRRAVTLQNQIALLRDRQTQGAEVLRQTEGNLELFTEQYKLGRRTLLELVGQYDAFARMNREHVSLAHEIALTELELARDRGLLVDGARL